MVSLTLGEGYLFAGRYQIGSVLGKGGMGTVYQVIHLQTARQRALKVMAHPIANRPGARDRFMREAQLGGRINSPFLVDVLDARVDDVTGLPYLVMELLRGEDLGSLSGRLGPLPAGDTVRYLAEAAMALDCCHAAGVIHRDIKPANLFLAERPDGGRGIKLLDLGIAKLTFDQETTTETIGTPAFMAPEQLAVGSPITAATDGYALGMVAYSLLVGQGFFAIEREHGSAFALADVIRSPRRDPATARAAAAGVTLPAAFDGFFARATAAAPCDRYPSATATIDALADALGIPPAERRASPAGHAAPGAPAGAPGAAGGFPPATASTIIAPEAGPRVAGPRAARPFKLPGLAIVVGALVALTLWFPRAGAQRSPGAPPPQPLARTAVPVVPPTVSPTTRANPPAIRPTPALPRAPSPDMPTPGGWATSAPAPGLSRRSLPRPRRTRSAALPLPPPAPPPLYSRD